MTVCLLTCYVCNISKVLLTILIFLTIKHFKYAPNRGDRVTHSTQKAIFLCNHKVCPKNHNSPRL